MASPHPALEYDSYIPDQERLREALCTVGNGHLATRGAAPECSRSTHHYPGTYIAGVYNRLTTEMSGRDLVNESLVNLPNWLPFTFRIEDGPWFDIDEVECLDYAQVLDLNTGVLVRTVRWRDGEDRITRMEQRRLVHMSRHHLATLTTTIEAENWDGQLTVRSWIDGGVENRGVERYSDLAGKHIEVLERATEPHLFLRVRTVQSRVEIVESARHRAYRGGKLLDLSPQPLDIDDGAGLEVTFPLERDDPLRIEKLVAIFTSRDRAISEPGRAARATLDHLEDYETLEQEHCRAWDDSWRRFDMELEPADDRTRLAIDLHLFHIIQTTSINAIDLDVGIPARGLHGEAYRGHIFWDELFVYPVLQMRVPEIARSLLLYRYRRLQRARRAAAEQGYAGAMFPWQSGSTGREASQALHLNPRSGRWLPDETYRQRHINLAIAVNVWRYYETSGDVEFLARHGAEMLLEIARFWASIATYNKETGRYDIVGVVGPDEFHTSDPNWNGRGLRNNAYTNVMAAWVLRIARGVLDLIPEFERRRICEMRGFDDEEMASWDEISRKLTVPLQDGIISQFQGYANLKQLDWDAYREKYGNIQRLDRILEAEGDDVNNYKASKQADVLMLFYLLSYEELEDLFATLGVPFDAELVTRTIDYYMAHTSHGSTLSYVVHSWVLARSDPRGSMDLFRRALQIDLSDVQGGTTEEGIHLGAMAGTIDLLQRGYPGMRVRDGVLRFKPRLPDEVDHLGFRITMHGRWLEISFTDGELQVESEQTALPPIEVECHGERKTCGSGETVVFAAR